MTPVGGRGAGRVRIAVADKGPGISPELAERIFLPGVSGSGLGLALAQRIARTAGGDIELSPAAGGGGATFMVALPAHAGRQQRGAARV